MGLSCWAQGQNPKPKTLNHKSYSLNSFKGVMWGLYRGLLMITIMAIKGDTRCLDYSS